jgi:hypothetical protein
MIVSRPILNPQATFKADCLATDSIGNFVYISSSEVSGKPQVTKVDITSTLKTPAVGVIVSKITATSCVVQRLGRVDFSTAGITTLIPGRRYFINTDSLPVLGVPAVVSGFLVAQPIGVATSPTILDVRLGECVKILS